MAEEKKTTLEGETFNGTQVIRPGESTIPAFEKTCWKCGTKFLYISDAIKHDKDGDYVICPSCGAFISHQETPKTADSIPPKCASGAKCEDRHSKVDNSITTLEEAALENSYARYPLSMATTPSNLEINAKRVGYNEGFIAGAHWQKLQMPMPEDTVIFQKGIEEGKRQMMKDAVEGYVNYYEDGSGKLMAEAQVGCPYHSGDKVKIVIIPNKEE